jgi:UDP-N-acetylglucosamine 2-epimerase (non-hydrolysing)
MVVGDVNATIACGLAAVRNGFPLAHVEAGLRSFDRSMPEEIHRLLTDRIADLLFVTEPSGEFHLLGEGVPPDRIFFVGNVMADTLLYHRDKAANSTVLDRLNLVPDKYAIVTLHRPANVDDPSPLEELIESLSVIHQHTQLVFPIHPRTLNQLRGSGLKAKLDQLSNIMVMNPLGYLDFLKLMEHARFVLTDSGGIQEETTLLGIPCITVRDSTERPITVLVGTNEVVGRTGEAVVDACLRALSGSWKKGSIPPLWDGHAAERIAKIIVDRYASNTVQERALPRLARLPDLLPTQ